MTHQFVTIPFRKSTLVLSLEEAAQLSAQLTEVLGTQVSTDQLRAPVVDPDGFLTRASVWMFFAQVYDTPSLLRVHAGKLVGRISNAARYGRIKLVRRCSICHKPLEGLRGCTTKSGHNMDTTAYVDILAQSLRELDLDTFRDQADKTGPSTHADLALLKQYL